LSEILISLRPSPCVSPLPPSLTGILDPMFRFSDTWQLVINTGTPIITFLIVVLIKNTQTVTVRRIKARRAHPFHPWGAQTALARAFTSSFLFCRTVI
jgi:hypothetical protein